MLRALIGTGLLLMTVGFGAAGWQYWKTLPATAEASEPAAPVAVAAKARQGWLISSTGGLVPQADVRAYLAQERFVPERILRVERQAALADLLQPDEKLPDAPFLQVLADIRAPQVAEGLCPALLDTIAQDCAVNAARVVEGSVDPVGGTAMFRLELVFRLKEEAGALPDLATRVLRDGSARLDIAPGAEGSGSAEAALRALVGQVTAACAAETVGELCRPLSLSLEWVPGQPVQGGARIGWLDPLPKGMFVAPPLDAGG